MTRRRHLIVMARAPRLGTAKRRLARDIGHLEAWQFYRNTLTCLTRRLAPDRRWRTWLAVTPDRTANAGVRWPASARVIAQGRGDLGARMARLVRALPPGPAVIVGSDIPELGAGHVARAFRLLGRNDWVLGPAADGGYWLIGAKRLRLPRDPFARVRWSSEHALADTLANLRPGRIAYLEELADIDTGANLAAYLRRRVSIAPL